ncbi:response regulator [bacterium]|nr:response regulator [bacterium]
MAEFFRRNNIETFVTFSAYEGLSWLRKNKAEIILISLPAADMLWSSFRENAALISPSSYFVAVGACEGGGPVENVNWAEQHGFDYKPEERVVKVKEPACGTCLVMKAVYQLLVEEFAMADVYFPGGHIKEEERQSSALLDEGDASADRRSGLASAGQPPLFVLNDTVWLRKPELSDDSTAVGSSPVTSGSSSAADNSAALPSSEDAAALQQRVRHQSELLRFWEDQWGVLIQMLSLGLQVGVSARHLYDDLGIMMGFAELLLSKGELSAQGRELLESLSKRALAAFKRLNNLDEALHMGSLLPLTYINPRIVISDVVRSLNYARTDSDASSVAEVADGGYIRFGSYSIKFSDAVADFALYGDQRQFSSLVLNLLLWTESNRNLWRQYRMRLASLVGSDANADETMDSCVTIDVSVIDGTVLHIRITEPCCLAWPAELLGTPERLGPLYSSLTLVWPGTQISVWGLALVRAVTALHQGRVEVANTEEGLVLDLEISHRISLDNISESPWTKEESSKALARLLFVEDDAKGVRESVYALRKAGFEVLVCDRADTALDTVRHNECHALILDLNLPDMNGMDLYRAIVNEQPRLAQRAVFVTGFLGTGFFMDSELRRFFAENHCLYLAKPYSARELLRSVQSTLSKRIVSAEKNLSDRVL